MKKILSLALIAVLTMAVLVGCGKSSSLKEENGTLEITGKFGSATTVTLNEVKSSATEYKTMTSFLEDKATSFACYDIKIADKDGKTVQPDGKVEVKLKLSEKMASATGDAYTVLYVDGDKYARIDCTENNGYVVFETDHFSVYTVVKYKNDVKDTFDGIPKDEDGKMETLHTHTYKETITKEPTCEENGSKTFSCDCGDTYAEEIPVLEHSFGEFAYNNDATYDADGTETRICSTCGKAESRVKEGTKLVKQEETKQPAETKQPEATKEPETTKPSNSNPYPNCKMSTVGLSAGTIIKINEYSNSKQYDADFIATINSGMDFAQISCDGTAPIYSQPDDVTRDVKSDGFAAAIIPATHKIGTVSHGQTFVSTGRSFDTNGGDYEYGTTFFEVEYNGGLAYIPCGSAEW